MQAPYFDDAPTRASLLNFLTGQLADLLPKSAPRSELAGWLSVLDTRALAGCLRQTAEQSADALAVAIRRRAAELEPGEAVGDIVADLYPRLAYADRERLRLLVVAMRDLARANDGCVLARDLMARGFGMAEQTRFGAQALEVMAALDGRAVLRGTQADRPAAERLRDIGNRVAARDLGGAGAAR